MKNIKLLGLLVIITGLVLSGCAGGGKGPENGESNQQPPAVEEEGSSGEVNAEQQLEQMYLRSDDGAGGVEVSVFWGAPEYFTAIGDTQSIERLDLENNIVFEVSMTTHSGDLRDYPMLEKAELVVGDQVLKPTQWELSSQDSHHPAGVLVFPVQDEKGEKVIKKDSVITLNMPDLRDVPQRIFTWELPLN